jgi:two-component system, NarL family, sensor kinase
MKTVCLLAFFCTVLAHSRAQLVISLDDDAAYFAKLEKDAAAATSDSARAAMYFRLSTISKLVNDTVKGNGYLRKALDISKRYPYLEAMSYFYQAQVQIPRQNFLEAERLLLTGDSLLQKFNTKAAYKMRALSWQNYAILQQIKGDQKAVMEVLLNKAVPNAEKSEDAALKGGVYKIVGIVFMNINQREKAAEYLQKAITFIEAASPDNPTHLEELVEAYIIAAENHTELNHTDSARLLLDKAAVYLAPQPRSNLYPGYYYAEGLCFTTQKRFEQALTSLNKGLALAQESGADYHYNRLLHVKYKAYFGNGQYAKAAAVLEDLMKRPLLFAADKKKAAKELYITYNQMRNIPAAYRWATQYIQISDSLNKAEVEKNIAELEQKYNNAENQKQIVLLNAEKQKAELTSKNNRLLAWLLGGGCALLALVSLLVLLYYRNNKKLLLQKELNHQQQLKETAQQQQIQFTEALLMGEERERKRLAADLHDGLGGMLAGVKINLSRMSSGAPANSLATDLPRVINQLDNSVAELRRIARNMMPESLLSSGLEIALKDLCESMITETVRVDFQAFDIDTTMAPQTQATIYRIVQELLTNAYRHALASAIMVQCSQNGNTFFITVEDNGKGFDVNAADNGKGIGLLNVKNRVDYLKGKMETDSAVNQGTTINIELNVA